MAYTLVVLTGDSTSLPFELADGRHRLGAREDVEVRIDHPEIGGLVATIDIRGGAVFMRNLNPFPIFVGDFELAPSEQTEWRPGLPVLLTQSVSLDIRSNELKPSQLEDEARAKRKRSMNQLAVIGICVLLGGYLLMSDSAPPDSTKRFSFSFNDIAEELASSPAHHNKIIRNYLTDARVADIRWGRENPKRAIALYQLLLDEKPIRDAPSSEETIEGKIKIFALARIDDLSRMLKPK